MGSYIVDLKTAGTVVTSGDSGKHNILNGNLAISIDLTQIVTVPTGGSPTLDFEVEWSPDGTNFGSAESADTFSTKSAIGVFSKLFTVKAPWHRLKWTLGGTVGEEQSIVTDHNTGDFTLSFDGQGPTNDIPYDAPVVSTFSEGTLTLDTLPIDGIAAEATLTLDTALTDGDEMTVDAKTYVFLDEIVDNEVQSLYNQATSGDFTLSFDGQGPTGALEWDAPDAPQAAKGTLTLGTEPQDPINAQGTLTLAVEPIDGDNFTVDTKTYTFKTLLSVDEVQSIYNGATDGTFTVSFDGQGPSGDLDHDVSAGDLKTALELFSNIDTVTVTGVGTVGDPWIVTFDDPGATDVALITSDDTLLIGGTSTIAEDTAGVPDVDGKIAIGGSLASAQANLEAAFDLSGTAGADYATAMTAHTTVSIGNFAANVAILTANDYGIGGNSIASTSAFDSGSNLFDATSLGTETLGVAADTYTIDTKVYTFETILQDVDGRVFIGGSLAQAKLNLVAAIDLSGVAGTDYATSMTAHGSVDVAAFGGDDAVLTAQVAGLASDAIATTSAFEDGGNSFDDTTLGTTLEGLNGLETELEALSNITNVSITGAGTIGDPWIITFVSPGNEDVPAMTADDTNLLGGTPASVIAEETAGVADTDGVIHIGGSLADSKANLVAAFDLSGVAGTDYATAMTAHTTVDIAAFGGNDAVLTAKTKGTAGNSLASTSSFFTGTNQFDDTSFGNTTTGVANDTYTIDTKTYTFQETLTDVDGNVFIGGSLAQAKLNLVAAMDLSGVAGTDYALAMTAHTTVDIAAFIVDDVFLTAKTAGAAGELIDTTETFFASGNIFDDLTLGTVTEGIYGVETELELLSNIDDVTVVRNGAGDWDVTWPFGVGDVAIMTIDASGLSGGSSATITTGVEAVVTTVNFIAVEVPQPA